MKLLDYWFSIGKIEAYCASRCVFMFTTELYLYGDSNGLSKILELAKARTFQECGNCSKAGSILHMKQKLLCQQTPVYPL